MKIFFVAPFFFVQQDTAYKTHKISQIFLCKLGPFFTNYNNKATQEKA